MLEAFAPPEILSACRFLPTAEGSSETLENLWLLSRAMFTALVQGEFFMKHPTWVKDADPMLARSVGLPCP